MSKDFSSRLLYRINGIRFKTWLYFFVLTVTVLSAMFLVQMLSFARFYERRQRDNIERVGETILEAYNDRRGNLHDFKSLVTQTEHTTDVFITFFYVSYQVDANVITVDEDSFVNILSLPKYGGESSQGETFSAEEQYLRALSESQEPFVFMSNQEPGLFLVFGAKLNDPQDGEVFLHIKAPLEISDFTLSVLQRQSVFSGIVCIALSVFLSWLVSSRIARPIKDFSNSATRLAKGDYSVRFVGNGLSEIEMLADTLNYATDEIAKSDKFRRELLANVSHDLRTPLTMVKAYAEMIRDISGGDTQKRTSHSQTIIDEADRLTMLVNDIQNISKLQSGTDPIEKTEVDLTSLTKQVLERFDIYSQTDNYIIECDLDKNLTVLGDEKKLEQVLYNLIGNAINYTGSDKTIKISLKMLQKDVTPLPLNSKDEGKRTPHMVEKYVVFSVKDSGKGIQKDEIDSIWERYYRASQSKRKQIGTGLGLSIVKNILILHEAEYGINSTVGKGSTFWFSLKKL